MAAIRPSPIIPREAVWRPSDADISDPATRGYDLDEDEDEAEDARKKAAARDDDDVPVRRRRWPSATALDDEPDNDDVDARFDDGPDA